MDTLKLDCPYCREKQDIGTISKQSRLEICEDCKQIFWVGAIIIGNKIEDSERFRELLIHIPMAIS